MNKPKLLQYCNYTAAGALCVSLFLHLCLIYFLRRTTRGLTNQKLLIMNLSIAELLFIPSGLLFYLRILSKTPGTLAYELTTVTFSVVALNCYWATALVIVDRTIAAFFPLRYRLIFSPKRVKIIMAILWCLSLFVPVLYVILGYERFITVMILFSLLLDAVMLTLAIVGYVYIYIVTARRRKRFMSQNRESCRRNTRQRRHIFKVALPIILSFFILVTLPDIVSVLLSARNIDPLYYRKLLYTISSFDILVDPLLLLYQFPQLRNAVRVKFGLSARQPSTSVSASMTMRSRSSTVIMQPSDLASKPSGVHIEMAISDTKL